MDHDQHGPDQHGPDRPPPGHYVRGGEGGSVWTVLGGNPAPGDVDAIRGAGGDLRRFHGLAQDARREVVRFASASQDSGWEGTSATAFGPAVATIARDLSGHTEHLWMIASTLDGWADVLDDLQAEARVLLAEAEAAQGSVEHHLSALGNLLGDPDGMASGAVAEGGGADDRGTAVEVSVHQRGAAAARAALDRVRAQAEELRGRHTSTSQRYTAAMWVHRGQPSDRGPFTTTAAVVAAQQLLPVERLDGLDAVGGGDAGQLDVDRIAALLDDLVSSRADSALTADQRDALAELLGVIASSAGDAERLMLSLPPATVVVAASLGGPLARFRDVIRAAAPLLAGTPEVERLALPEVAEVVLADITLPSALRAEVIGVVLERAVRLTGDVAAARTSTLELALDVLAEEVDVRAHFVRVEEDAQRLSSLISRLLGAVATQAMAGLRATAGIVLGHLAPGGLAPQGLAPEGISA